MVGPCLSVARDPYEDQTRVDTDQFVPREPPALQRTRAEVLHQYINTADQAAQYSLPLGNPIGDPATGMAAVNKAGSDPDVVGIIGLYNSPIALAATDTIHQHGIATIIHGVNYKITQSGYPELFRLPPMDSDLSRTILGYMADEMGKKRVYVLDDQTAFGKTIAEHALAQAAETGVEIIGSESVTTGEKDFTAVLTKIKALNPDVLFYTGYNAEGSLLRQQMLRLGMNDRW